MVDRSTKGTLMNIGETNYENGVLVSTIIGIRQTGFSDVSPRIFYGPVPIEYVGVEVSLREWNEAKEVGKGGLTGLTARLAKVTAQELSVANQIEPGIPTKITTKNYNPKGD